MSLEEGRGLARVAHERVEKIPRIKVTAPSIRHLVNDCWSIALLGNKNRRAEELNF